MAVTRPVMRYHGGKFGALGHMADWIISHLPPHRVYVEPYGGAASVLMRKPRAYAEVYNDLADEVVNVFRVLRDRPEDLRRLLALTPFARTEFEHAYQPTDDPLEQARRTIFRAGAGFGSAAATRGYRTGFRANSNRANTSPAHDWAHYPEHVATFAERLQGVVIEHRPAMECMRQHDGPETLHFVDPPYVHDTRRRHTHRDPAYEFEMTDDQHTALAGFLLELEGMVVLCGYPSPLYEHLYAGWQSVSREAYADGARRRTEVLWFNRAAWEAVRQPGLFCGEVTA